MRKNNQIYCNCCGGKISENAEKITRDFLHIEKVWGYFSKKDGEHHSFDLCEACSDRMRKEFVLEEEIWEETELI